MYGFYGLKHHTVEIGGDVTMRDGRTDGRTTNEQGKIMLLSLWMLEGWVSQQYHLVSQARWLLFSDRSGYRVLFPFLGTTDLLLDVAWPQRISLVPETFAPLVGWYLHILLADALFCALRLGSQCSHLLLLLSHSGYRGCWEGLPRINTGANGTLLTVHEKI